MRTKSTYWGQRADKAHLTTETLQILTKVNQSSLFRSLVRHQDDGGMLSLLIIAWEVMNNTQRKKWVAQAKHPDPDPAAGFLAVLLGMPEEPYSIVPAVLFMAWDIMDKGQQKDWLAMIAERKAVTAPRSFKKEPS